ncbi:HEAT repeat domain-containing protein [Spirillospora sp. NPDC047279]|uniref:HEAT repeat domain-containing protein n=1 Tax=Spirillospora sp. NPDC047279 TaxID=3155478 RepID=UPI003403C277
MEVTASDLIGMLGDPDEAVRHGAVRALCEFDPATVVPRLRRLRHESRGPLRRRALEALAAVGGPDALDDHDRAVIRRLIRVKIRGEVPAPMHLCGSWFALPTPDQEAVLDAFGLSSPEPVTMRLGAGAWNHDNHDWAHPRAEHRGCHRVYVSPVLDGWTLVFGDRSDDVHRTGPPRDEAYEERLRGVVLARCAALGLRFGAAHWYGVSCGDGWTAWTVAEGGEIVRHYDVSDPDDQIGRPLPAEEGLLPPHVQAMPEGWHDGVDLTDAAALRARHREVRERLGIPATCHATVVAAGSSVDPAALGPATRVEGHGVLALTDCGREHGHPRGALAI